MSRASGKASASGRRRFLRVVGLTGIASAVGSTSWAANSRPTTPTPAAPAKPDSSQSAAPPPISEDAKALSAIVQRRYGKHLTAKQLEAVEREIENRLQGGRRLRETQLANSTEPEFVFHAG
jgi:hypothetical protein